jgi:hypothetical protein
MFKYVVSVLVSVLFVTTVSSSVAQEPDSKAKQQSALVRSTVSVMALSCKVTQRADKDSVYTTLNGVKPETKVVVCATKSSNCTVASVAEGPAGNLWSCVTPEALKKLKEKIPFMTIIVYPTAGLINPSSEGNDSKDKNDQFENLPDLPKPQRIPRVPTKPKYEKPVAPSIST